MCVVFAKLFGILTFQKYFRLLSPIILEHTVISNVLLLPQDYLDTDSALTLIMIIINSLFAKYKLPVCHIILGHTGIGATFRSIMFNSLYLFTCKSYGKFQKAKLITHADSANQKQW